jgi:hypothetical protein
MGYFKEKPLYKWMITWVTSIHGNPHLLLFSLMVTREHHEQNAIEHNAQA